VVYCSAPHACPAEAVERFYGGSSLNRLAPPHLAWWDATDDGREYRGWEATREHVRALLVEHAPAGVLGFSQGAILGTGPRRSGGAREFPVAKVCRTDAGRTPRATVFQPLFDRALSLPSLHVWGERDGMAEGSRELVAALRRIDQRSGHMNGRIASPRRPGASAIVRFLERHAAP